MTDHLNLLLDTHILLWWLANNPRLTSRARSVIQDSEAIWVSSVSAWEIESKRSRGLLDAPGDLEGTLATQNMRSLPLSLAHAVAAARLPYHHRDPFDRMLVAQASMESLVLLTADAQLAAYGVPVMLA